MILSDSRLSRCKWIAWIATTVVAAAADLAGEVLAPSYLQQFVQSTSDPSGLYPAVMAVDGDGATYSRTDDIPGSYWQVTLKRSREIRRIAVLNGSGSTAAEMGGQTLRIYDLDDQSVFSTAVVNPGPGGTWSVDLPSNTCGRIIRFGLEDGAVNNAGSYHSGLAEMTITCGDELFSSPALSNVALGAESCMLRLTDVLAPASYANDGNLITEAVTSEKTVDGYWEVDLGDSFAVYAVESIAAVNDGLGGPGDRNTNTTLRLYNERHDSVYSEPVSGSMIYTNDVGGPRIARYVRLGLENKTRTDPEGGREWYIGFKEVRVFARPVGEVGLLSFSASAGSIAAGAPVTLSWEVEGVHRVELYPSIGSVGAYTASDGSGSIELYPGESTEYVLTVTGAGFTNVQAVTVVVDVQVPALQISEFAADNQYSLKDGYGDDPDWIEIRNPSGSSVDMTGYGLSDSPDRPMKWIFPSVTIPPNSHLLVFASGREEPFDPEGGLHAAFRLASSGESILLTKPNGTDTVDAILNYPPQQEDLAYGRDMDGGLVFIEPTPGNVNLAATYLGWLVPPSYSHQRGFYDAAFSLTLSNGNAGAEAFYSLDGSEPTIPYTEGIPVSGTVTVRSQVRRAGYKSPQSQTQTYVFIDDVVASTPWVDSSVVDAYPARLTQGLQDLPAVSLVLPGGEPDYPEAAGSMEMIWPDGTENLQANCGIKRFGGAWTEFDKKNFRVKFRSAYGTSKLQAPLFNGFERGVQARARFDELEFVGGGHDMVLRGFYMSGRFVEDAMLDMGSLNPHGRFVHLYLNGVYWGQFHMRERLVEHFLADYLGGDDEDYVAVRGNDNIKRNFSIGDPAPPDREAWNYVRAHINDYESIRTRLDVTHYIDYMLLWLYGDCEAEFRACGPVEAGSGFKFWIADADGFLRTRAIGQDKTDTPGPGNIFGGLVAEAHPDFMTLLADRTYRHFFNNGALTPGRNSARLDRRMEEIADSKMAECARWGYRTPASWEDDAAQIQAQLFPVRSNEMLVFLRNRGLYPAFNPPVFNQHGGVVTNGFPLTLSAEAGTVYYTLDGSDPRLPGGGISGTALIYSSPGSPVLLAGDTVVRTRGFHNGTWSALNEARFWIGDPDAFPMQTRISLNAGSFPVISFSPFEGEFYEVHYTDSLTMPEWHRLADLQAVNTNRIEVIDAGSPANSRFYRIHWIYSGIEHE